MKTFTILCLLTSFSSFAKKSLPYCSVHVLDLGDKTEFTLTSEIFYVGIENSMHRTESVSDNFSCKDLESYSCSLKKQKMKKKLKSCVVYKTGRQNGNLIVSFKKQELDTIKGFET